MSRQAAWALARICLVDRERLGLPRLVDAVRRSTGSAASAPQPVTTHAATTSASAVRNVTGQGCIIDRWRRRP
jgi:hypothetical protein